MRIFILNFLMGFFSSEFLSRSFFHRMTRNLFGGFLLRRLLTEFRGCDLSGRCRYPLRVENVPQISQIYTDFSWDVFFVTQISQMTQIFFSWDFYSSDDTEFIRRFPAEAITHGFSRMRPVRSLQIPPEIGQSPTDFTDIHRFWTCSVFGKKHADFADDAVFLFGYLGNFPFDYGKNESV